LLRNKEKQILFFYIENIEKSLLEDSVTIISVFGDTFVVYHQFFVPLSFSIYFITGFDFSKI
jgi:hypothetical protein